MHKKSYLQVLKVIGVLLFVWILLQIDTNQIWISIAHADQMLLLGSFGMLFMVYTIKTVRWHIIARTAGSNATLYESWQVYHIGVFFAAITPAKIGEFGRAIYLKQQGMNNIAAFGTAIFDRAADAMIIAALTIPALWILFGRAEIFLLALVCLLCVFLVFGLLFRTSLGKRLLLLVPLLHTFLLSKTSILILAYTVVSWCAYYAWILLIAAALHIDVSPLIICSTATIAGIVALLPIAPSGLGTRDAVFLYFLGALGVQSETVVSLTLIMFGSIILSSFLGGIYWLKGVR